jgi:hypothetical protein
MGFAGCGLTEPKSGSFLKNFLAFSLPDGEDDAASIPPDTS